MNDETRSNGWLRLVLILLVLAPLVILFFLPGGGLIGTVIWFWVLLLPGFFLLWLLLSRRGVPAEAAEPEWTILYPNEQPAIIQEIMNVRLATQEQGVYVFRGRLREPAESAYRKLKHAYHGQMVPLVQEDDRFGTAVVLMPRPIEQARLEQPVRPWFHWFLFAATVVTTTWAGAAHQGFNLLAEPLRFTEGLPYAIGLLSILGVHEMGHYFAARRHGMNVTPPYFIPVPFALGTFGAFIQMRSPAENRRALFDVAVAGPLAGLAVAVPALLIGLQSSKVVEGLPVGDEAGLLGFTGGASVSKSVMFAMLAKIALPDALRYGCVIALSPLAFAGWLGLLITALNLLPIGQLDGGHTARSMFGHRTGSAISNLAMWSLFLLALFVWQALMMWVIIVYFLAGTATPPLNDITPLTPGRRWLGYATFAILVLILLPVPASLMSAAGIYCPYL